MNTDPELCAAVARAMGKTNAHLLPAGPIDSDKQECWVGKYDDDLGEMVNWAFSPDLPGADFCEALAWVQAHDNVYKIEIDASGPPACLLFLYSAETDPNARGESIEQALCRAIAALGEAE